MSALQCHEPVCVEGRGAVELVIEPRARDLGGFSVRRVLPSAERTMVGPFIFFDEMGPAVFPPGSGIDVRPHPHIGLATVTYLFDGEIVHRDSLGFVQSIEPGAVNLMTAGRGIVHSERAGPDRALHSSMHGIQTWMALPTDQEETAPAFVHYPAAAVPQVALAGCRARIVIGSAFGATSPVATFSPTLYIDALLDAGADVELPADVSERAIYVVSGSVGVDAETYRPQTMLVIATGAAPRISAREPCRIIIIGGEPVGQRRIWWNFVSSSRERIERAKADWRDGRFGTIAGDDEFIPLPES
jgi:redox-sensitive bicupin YhaK (pirin superfamily)